MTVRRYLSELDGERLIALYDSATDVADEDVAASDLPQRDLLEDLRDAYPGLLALSVHIVKEFEETEKASPDFLSGAFAGALLMADTIRRAAEHDDIASSM